MIDMWQIQGPVQIFGGGGEDSSDKLFLDFMQYFGKL